MNNQNNELIKVMYVCLGLNLFVLFMAITVGKGKNSIFAIIILLLVIANIVKMKKSTEKEDNEIENGKIVVAKVILVDNFHTPKKLICQREGENGIAQYQKEKNNNFTEKLGDIVEVKVDVMNESRYEILDK